LEKQTRHISTTHEEWKADVIPAVNELIKVSSDFKLPETLIQRAAWLANGDVDAANRILASLELEEAKVRANYLSVEFKRIQSLVDHMPHTQSIRHSIELPQGNIVSYLNYREHQSLGCQKHSINVLWICFFVNRFCKLLLGKLILL